MSALRSQALLRLEGVHFLFLGSASYILGYFRCSIEKLTSNRIVMTEEGPSRVSPFLIGVVCALVAALAAGGGVYAYEYHQNSTNQTNLQAQVDSLKSQLATMNMASPTPTATPTATPSSSATPTSNIFTTAALDGATVKMGGSNYTMSNGSYVHPGTGPFGPGTYDSIVLDANHIAVDSANASQAAIVLTVTEEYPGAMGAGTFEELEVMTNNANKPVFLSQADLSSLGATATTVSSLSFASNVITVATTTAGTSSTKSFLLSGTTLVQQ